MMEAITFKLWIQVGHIKYKLVDDKQLQYGSDSFYILGASITFLEWLKLQFSNFVHR